MYNPKYETKYCEELIKLAMAGVSPYIFASRKLIAPRLIDEWKGMYEEFDDAYKLGILSYLDYWNRELVSASYDEENGKERMAIAKIMIGQIELGDRPEVLYTKVKKRGRVVKEELDKSVKDLIGG